MTQAYTKYPVSTQNNLWEHKIILVNQKKVVLIVRHWLTQKILCVLKGICAKTFFCLVKVMWSTQRLLCVDKGFSGSACFIMGSFSAENVTFKTRMLSVL